MLKKLLVTLTFLPAIAFASPAATSSELDAAIAREKESSTRVKHYEQLTTIAERDIATATIRQSTARKYWDSALRADDPSDAAVWAKRFDQAKREEADARERVTRFSHRRDLARADVVAATERRRQLTQQARR
jgi:hypothetical protein